MIDLNVECPVCEECFRVPANKNTDRIACPSCQRTFEIDATISTEDEQRPSIPTAAPTLRTSPVAEAKFVKPESAGGLLPGEKKSVDIESHSPARSKSAIDIRSRYDLKKRSKSSRFTIALIGLILLTSVLGVALVIKVRTDQSRRIVESDPTSEMLPNEPAMKPVGIEKDSKTAKDGNTADASPESASPLESQQPSPRKIPPQKFFHFGKSEVEDCWKLAQPHLLSLKIHGPTGTQQATGTIVDSRGWIVTSYHAIKNAWQVEATAAVKSLSNQDESQPLQDLVRGIIATDPENDLALLAVNRRFVVSFADVKMSTANRLVPGEHLVQCGPPSEKNPHGASEAKVENRSRADELSEFAKSRAQQLNLDTSDQPWLTTSGGEAANAGTPLFKIDGTMVALIVFANDDLGYALPVAKLRGLIDSSKNEITPFKMPVGSSQAGSQIELPLEGAGQELIAELNRHCSDCETFQWMPQNRQQYQSLQQFSKTIIRAFDFVTEDDDEAAVQLVQQRLGFWEKRLAAELGKIVATDQNRLSGINQFAASEIKKGNKNHVVFYGSVYIGGIETPKQILKFDEMEAFVNAPIEPESRPMLPGTNWLFFVETMPLARHVDMDVPGEGIIPTESANILYAVGPIKKR